MGDPLTLAIIYAILKKCVGLSLDEILDEILDKFSSKAFGSIKDKFFKKKGKSEKELLNDVIQELKKSGIGKEIAEKEDRILSVSLEYYSKISKDTKEIESLSNLLNEKVDEIKREGIEISEKTEELRNIVSEFDLPKTYKIFNRDLAGVKDALYIHPTIIEGYIERPEVVGLTAYQNIRILGKPGSGKTTAIYKIIEHSNPEQVVLIKDEFTEIDIHRLLREDLDDNFLLVWDDFPVRPKLFRDTIYKLRNPELRNKFENFYILCAAKSTEIEKINDEIMSSDPDFWNKVNLTEVIELQELEIDQNKELI